MNRGEGDFSHVWLSSLKPTHLIGVSTSATSTTNLMGPHTPIRRKSNVTVDQLCSIMVSPLFSQWNFASGLVHKLVDLVELELLCTFITPEEALYKCGRNFEKILFLNKTQSKMSMTVTVNVFVLIWQRFLVSIMRFQQ